MKRVKTTKADFKLFKHECKKWIRLFGLKRKPLGLSLIALQI